MKSMPSPFVGAWLVVLTCTDALKVLDDKMKLNANQSNMKLLASGIPRIIMQTSANKLDKQRLGPLWTRENPDHQYHFLDDADGMEFLNDEYGSEYAQAFNNVLPGAIKADFLRLAWIYKHGGFYIDIDKKAHRLEAFVDAADIVIPHSLGVKTCMGHLYNGFIAAKAGSLFIKQALDEALIRASSNWKPWTNRCPLAGPCNTEQNLVKVCYAIAGPVLLGEKLCHNLPPSASHCEYRGGGISGTGCRMQPNSRSSLKTGETIVVFSEQALDLPYWTPWKNPQTNLAVFDVDAISDVARHYWQDCNNDHIYRAESDA